MFRASIFASAAILALFPQIALADCVETDFTTDFTTGDLSGGGSDGPAVVPPSPDFVSVPTTIECEGVTTDPVLAGPSIRKIVQRAGGELSTIATAIQSDSFEGEMILNGLVSSETGHGIYLNGPDTAQREIVAQRIEAGLDAIRIEGDDTYLRGSLYQFSAGGSAVFANEIAQGNFIIGIGDAGEYGVHLPGGHSQVSAGNPTNDAASLVTGADSFFLGEEAWLYAGRVGNLEAGAYEIRTTGAGSSAVNLSSGYVAIHGVDTKVVSEKGAAIKFRDSRYSVAYLEGEIEGAVGLVYEEEATEFRQVQLIGTLRGTSGVAAQMNTGFSEFFVSSFEGQSAFIDGDIIFGDGSQRFTFLELVNEFENVCGEGPDGPIYCDPTVQDYTFNPTGEFLSEGSIIDGGEGLDTVDISLLTSMSIVSAVLNAPNDVSLTLQWPEAQTTARFVNFESFQFSDRTLSMSDFGAVSAVPLPAPALMLGAALVGLGGASRRKRRAA